MTLHRIESITLRHTAPATLTCDECGGDAIASTSGIFYECDGDACASCGLPGTVRVDDMIARWVSP